MKKMLSAGIVAGLVCLGSVSAIAAESATRDSLLNEQRRLQAQLAAVNIQIAAIKLQIQSLNDQITKGETKGEGAMHSLAAALEALTEAKAKLAVQQRAAAEIVNRMQTVAQQLKALGAG